MVVVLFSTTLRPDADLADYEATGGRMVELVQQVPGFVSMESYSGADGSELTIARFTSQEAIDEWRSHPEHRRAQAAGRERFYERYRIEVCTSERSHGFDRSEGPSDGRES
jgi:heme-degrading monooxygenase HmoA